MKKDFMMEIIKDERNRIIDCCLVDSDKSTFENMFELFKIYKNYMKDTSKNVTFSIIVHNDEVVDFNNITIEHTLFVAEENIIIGQEGFRYFNIFATDDTSEEIEELLSSFSYSY